MRAVVVSRVYASPASRGKLRALAGLGCTVAAAVPAQTVAAGGEAIETRWEDDGGVRLVPVAVRGDAAAPAGMRWAARTIRGLIKDFRPDVIQIEEEPWTHAAAVAAAEARRFRVPAVLFTWDSVARPLPLSLRLRRRSVLRTVRGVIAGNRLAEALVARVVPDLRRTVLAQTGVVPPIAPATGSGGFSIGFVGRLVPEKGLDLLFRACVRLNGPWDIAVIGTGPAQVELEALAERLGIAARVTWHGGLPRADRERLWQHADCIVMPSRASRYWVETLGVPAVEAMAHGVAVVVTHSGALADTVGDAGIVVPEEDVAALTAALQRLLDDRGERAALAAAGRRRAMQVFTDEALAQRTLEFWQAVAAGAAV